MIKFVYFDVGGVALLDFSGTNKWEEMMTEIGINKKNFGKFDEFYKSWGGRQNLDLDVDDLMPQIETKFGVKFKNDYSLLVDGFVKRFERNPSLDTIITRMKKTCGVGLLTNMYPRMLGEIQRKKLLPEIKWDVVVDSSVEMVQKPNKAIYELSEQKCGFKGNEILFVENTQKHVDGAKELSWQTFLYNPLNTKDSNLKLLNYFRKNVK